MNLQLQIYVDTSGSPLVEVPIYERLDLFDFEAVELTSTIQDAQDIGEVFTDFSQTFKVPASKRNNKVFTHFYQSDLNTGFDSRIKQRAKLELGGVPFRNGFVSLTESNVKNGKAESYSITFYGAIVSLKEIIGDDELKSLADLDKFNHEYTKDNVWGGFSLGLGLNSSDEIVNSSDRDIVYPAISFLNKWYYSTSDPIGPGQVFNQGLQKNLRVDDSTKSQYGIKFTELKPAIKVKRIIEAIEQAYTTIQFSDDFFGSADFDDLYLLLSSKKGEIQGEDNTVFQKTYQLTGDNADLYQITGTDLRPLITNSRDFNASSYVITVNVTDVSPTNKEYDVEVYSGTTLLSGRLANTGNLSFDLNLESQNLKVWDDISIKITNSTGGIGYKINVDVLEENVSGNSTCNYAILVTQSLLDEIVITQQVPKIKILEFLRGLFKMFNLTAYYSNGVIIVDTLDNFYSSGDLIDLTKSLDNGDITVKRSKLYSDINFQFAEPKTFGVINQNEQNQDNFGNLEFQTLPDGRNRSLVFDGTKYEIKLPFEKGFFERMNDQDAATFTLTDFSNGWIVDKDQNETDIAPMLFYNVPTTINTTDWKFGFVDQNSYITQFNRASNSNATASKSLHFGEEFDEYTGNINTNSLFAIGYQNYVTNLFSINTRILSAEFYLSLDVLTQYKLNDKIRLKGKDYRINSIKSNLNTGKSTLELITSYD